LLLAGVTFAIAAGIWLTARDHLPKKDITGLPMPLLAAGGKNPRKQIISGIVEV
jgi:hypothetical protein